MQILAIFAVMVFWMLLPSGLYLLWLRQNKIPWAWVLSIPKIIVFSRRGVIAEKETPLISCHVPAESRVTQIQALQLAWSLISARAQSGDPISKAFEKVAQRNQWGAQRVEFFEESHGHGIAGVIDAKAILLGSEALMKKASLDIPLALEHESQRQQIQGHRVCYMGWQGEVQALFVLREELIEGVDRVVGALKERFGVKQCILATGADETLARSNAHCLGVDQYRSNLTPDQKIGFVESLKNQWGHFGVCWLEPRVSIVSFYHALKWRFWARAISSATMLAIALGLASFLFAGCSWDSQKTLRGYIVLGHENLRSIVNEPNNVCFLMVHDQWGVPIIIKRWLNPKFPLFFKLYSSDMLSPTRPWQGPFHLEAYLYSTENLNAELPPPDNAAKGVLERSVYPEIMQSLEIPLNRQN